MTLFFRLFHILSNIKRPFIFITVVFLLSTGCSTFHKRPLIQPDETNWKTIPAVINKNYNKLKTLQGTGRLTIETSQFNYTANSQIRLQKPDSLYIKVEAMFGIDVGTLFADSKQFILYTPMQNSYISGSIDSLGKVHFIDFYSNYSNLFQSLSGIEKIEKLNNPKLANTEKGLLLTGEKDSLYYHYWIDPYMGVIEKIEILDANNEIILLQEFDRFVKYQGVYLPKTIRLKKPSEKKAFTLFYNKLIVNSKLDKKDFEIKIPKTASQIEL